MYRTPTLGLFSPIRSWFHPSDPSASRKWSLSCLIFYFSSLVLQIYSSFSHRLLRGGTLVPSWRPRSLCRVVLILHFPKSDPLQWKGSSIVWPTVPPHGENQGCNSNYCFLMSFCLKAPHLGKIFNCPVTLSNNFISFINCPDMLFMGSFQCNKHCRQKSTFLVNPINSIKIILFDERRVVWLSLWPLRTSNKPFLQAVKATWAWDDQSSWWHRALGLSVGELKHQLWNPRSNQTCKKRQRRSSCLASK